MNDALPMACDDHLEVEMLLPWYVTSQLDADATLAIDAHLENCGACRQLLAEERQLRDAVVAIPEAAAVAAAVPIRFGLPRLRQTRSPSSWSRVVRSAAANIRTSSKVGWFLAAQAAVILIVFDVGQSTMQPSPAYRTLSSASSSETGNVIIAFEPTSTEEEIRSALKAVDAKIVGGPTASDAYILHVAESDRPKHLKLLRDQRSVILAEPIDGEQRP